LLNQRNSGFEAGRVHAAQATTALDKEIDMADTAQPMQADGASSKGAPGTPQGRTEGGESGGGAYKQENVTTGDNRVIERPVLTGRKPADEKAPDEGS
jgi:hypothetical protein